jgi:hypothetical protein
MATAKTAATGSLAEALVELQKELPTVPKGKTAKVKTKTGADFSYAYADLADVTAAVTPLLTKHGLSFTCLPRRCEDGVYELVGVLMHVGGDSIDGALPIRGGDPQAIGSAITYARRYLLGCLTGVVTDDDDDGAHAAAQERSGGSGARQGGNGRQRPAPRQDGPLAADVPHPRRAARDLTWATWRKHGGADDPGAFHEAFARANGGLNPADASAEQLAAWASDLEAAAEHDAARTGGDGS